jgi:hypothetical protein
MRRRRAGCWAISGSHGSCATSSPASGARRCRCRCRRRPGQQAAAAEERRRAVSPAGRAEHAGGSVLLVKPGAARSLPTQPSPGNSSAPIISPPLPSFKRIQVDDVFLATDSGFGSTYRATPADLLAHMQWQDALNARLPANSSVRLEMVRRHGLRQHGQRRGAPGRPLALRLRSPFKPPSASPEPRPPVCPTNRHPCFPARALGPLRPFPQVFNGNGVLIESASPAILYNTPPCFQTQLYAQLNCSCWNEPSAACPPTAPSFCRSCVKDWKRARGAPGVTYSPVRARTAGWLAWSGGGGGGGPGCCLLLPYVCVWVRGLRACHVWARGLRACQCVRLLPQAASARPAPRHRTPASPADAARAPGPRRPSLLPRSRRTPPPGATPPLPRGTSCTTRCRATSA